MAALQVLDGDLWQWDTGREVEAVGCEQVHFAKSTAGACYTVEVADGKAKVPDELLQAAGRVYAWAYITDEAYGGRTRIEALWDVKRRAKPAEYVYEPSDRRTIEDAETARDEAKAAQKAAEAARDGAVAAEVKGARATTLASGSEATAAMDGNVLVVGVPKGDALRYSDLTADQIAELKKPATDAAAEIGKTNEKYKAMLTEQAKAFGDAQQARTESYADAERARDEAYTKAETDRDAAYNEAEGKRQAAEGVRSENEGARRSAETERDTAEKARVEAEAKREQGWTDIKADAEKSVSDAVERADAANKAATKAIAEVKATEAKLYPAAENILKGKVKETFVHVDDAFPSSLLGIEVEGACKQDGTPSPDNPVPIEAIENPIIHICGKNLLKVDDSSATARGVTASSNNGVITLSGVATENGYCGSIAGVYLPNGAIGQKLALKIHAISGTIPQVNLLNTRYKSLLYSTQSPAVLNEQIAYMTCNVVKGVTYDCKFHVTVEVYGDADSGKYSPFNETSTSFTLPVEHPYLAKLPDGTADEIVVDRDGNVELVARVTKTVLDGSQFFNDVNLDGIETYYETSTPIGNGKLPDVQWGGLYDRFVTDNPYTFRQEACAFCFSIVNGILFRIRPSETFADAAGFNNWLKSNPVTSYHADTEPKTYNLGKIALPALPESVSNVWTDAEITPKTGIEYVRDVNIVVSDLEKAIASITEG